MALRPQPGYERQVRADTAAQPFASPDAFGAAIGRGLHDLGEAGERIELRERERDRDNQVADFNVRFAEARQEADKQEIDRRTAAQPGAAGHTNAAIANWTARHAALLDGITDPKVRNLAAERLAAYGEDLHGRAYAWEAGQRVEKLATDTGQSFDIGANRARLSDDPKVLGQELDQAEAGIAALAVTPDLRQKLSNEARAKIAGGYVDGMIDRDPQQAKALLKSGALNDYLSAAQMDAALSRTDVEIRRDETQARAELAGQTAEAREAINSLEKRLSDGVPQSDADMAKAQALAERFGLDGETYDLGKWRVINTANRVYRSATPIQIDHDLKALDAKIVAAGDKAKPEDVILRNHLASLLPQRSEQLRQDPLGFGAQALGMSIEPLNLNDPASIDRRVQQAKAIAASTGAPVRVLSDEEAELITANVKAGGATRTQAAGELARFGPYYGRAAAMQVAPDDVVLQRAVTLGPKTRELALIGPDFRKANPKIVPEREALPLYQQSVGRAIAQLGGEFNAATWETANNIYAGLVGRNGWHGEHLNAAAYTQAVNMALGATRRGSEWQGGVGQWNRRPVLLPTSMTQAEFDQAMANLARPMQGASNGSPVWADGTPVQAGQLRDRFRPVAVKDGVYRFEDAEGHVLGVHGGGEYRLDIRKIER